MSVVYLCNYKAGSISILNSMNDATSIVRLDEMTPSWDTLQLALREFKVVVLHYPWLADIVWPHLDDLKGHEIVTSARHPHSRFISAWNYCREKGWLPEGCTPRGVFTCEFSPESPAPAHLFTPQWGNVVSANGQQVASRILRVENLAQDYADFARTQGWPEDVYHFNRSTYLQPGAKYCEDDPVLAHGLRNIMSKDFEVLGYE